MDIITHKNTPNSPGTQDAQNSLLGYQRTAPKAENAMPLVLVHGFLAGSAMWQDQLQEFSKHYDVIAPSLPGFGLSNGLEAPQTIEGFAQSVIDLLDHLGIDKFCLLGHSMGGMVVQQMAVMVPDRITHLICYGTGAMGVLPDRFETIEQSRQRLKTDGLEKMSRQIAATWFMKEEDDPKFGLCLEMAADATPQAADASFAAWEKWDGRNQLKQITAKTMIIWGEHDRSYGWPQIDTLWNGIPECSLAVIPGCAHNVHLEKPAYFNMVLDGFLPKKC